MNNDLTSSPSMPNRDNTARRFPFRRSKAGDVARRSRRRRLFALASLSLLTALAISLLVAFVWVRSLSANLPGVDKIAEIRAIQPTVIVSSDGVVLAALQTQYRRPVSLDDIAPKLIDATIATEDSRFYTHQGIDAKGIARAVFGNLRAGNAGAQGASTITQQLARNIFLNPQKTMRRKIEEILLARKIEQSYSKREILEAYLNTIYYGSGAYGVEAASRTYFGKSAKSLTTGEAALLAGIPQRPTAFAPNTHRTAALRRRSDVLDRMIAAGKLTPEEKMRIEATPVHILPRNKGLAAQWKAPYFVSEVLEQLKAQYGEEFVYSGVRIETTLNWAQQQAAERALARAFHSGRGPNTGCLVSLDPRTGYVRALVGGPDYTRNQFNAATKGLRQPGSAFKPLLYATAFESNTATLLTNYSDEKKTYDLYPKKWTVHNYEPVYRGKVAVLDAIEHSINTVAVEVNEQTGPEKVVDFAAKLGLTTPLEPNLPLALGASAVHPIELVSAYSAFANAGERYDPTFILRVLDGHKQEGLHDDPAVRRHTSPFSAKTLDQVNVALREVVLHGTGIAAASIPDARGKTGTTSSHRDAWFVGYNSDLATAVWLAHVSRKPGHAPDGTKTIVETYAPMPGGTGGTLCAPIWTRYMASAAPVQQRVNVAHGVKVGPLPVPSKEALIARIQEDAKKAALAAAAQNGSSDPAAESATSNVPELPLNGSPPIADASRTDDSDMAAEAGEETDASGNRSRMRLHRRYASDSAEDPYPSNHEAMGDDEDRQQERRVDDSDSSGSDIGHDLKNNGLGDTPE